MKLAEKRALHTFIAFGGSAIYGASLSLLFPSWTSGTGALWIIMSSGLGWVVLGLGMSIVLRKHLRLMAMADICLSTMAWGIGVLMGASAVNLAAYMLGFAGVPMAAANVGLIIVSNAVMGIIFTKKMKESGVSARTAVTMWLVLLNGSGALFFWLFKEILR